MRNIERAAENVTNCVTSPHRHASLQTKRREPRSNLARLTSLEVRGIFLRPQQPRTQRRYPPRHNGIDEWIAETRAEGLNPVIQRARSRPQPKQLRCVARDCRIKNNRDWHHVAMVEYLLPFALCVGHQSAGIVFSTAQCRWDCDRSHFRRTKAALRSGSSLRHTFVTIEAFLLGDLMLQAHYRGFRNIDDGSAANADNEVGRSFGCRFGDRHHARSCRMLRNGVECSRVPAPQCLADLLYLVGGRIQRPTDDQIDPCCRQSPDFLDKSLYRGLPIDDKLHGWKAVHALLAHHTPPASTQCDYEIAHLVAERHSWLDRLKSMVCSSGAWAMLLWP